MRAAFLLLLLACSCKRQGDENLGLGAKAAPEVIDVSRITQPDELVKAFSTPGAELDRRLGAHRVDATATMKISAAGKPEETLDETLTLDSDGKGALHVLHDTNRSNATPGGLGMEAVVFGPDLYVKPRYGKYVRRRPEGDELERLRAVVEGSGGAYLDLVQRWLVVTDAGEANVAGHAGRKLKLGAKPSPETPTSFTDPGKKWRETLDVKYIQGEAVVDAQSGVPLSLRLDTAYSFKRDNSPQPVSVTATFKSTVAPAQPVTPPPPAEAVASPVRPRPQEDRKFLLENLTEPK